MKLKLNNKGFSLTEVLVAVLVLTMAVVSASNFLVSMMRSNSMNTSVLQAYYYSVEGLEAFRNMRDTYFMNYLDFCGRGDIDDGGVFGIEGGFCDPAKYVVTENDNTFGGAAFWKIQEVAGDGADDGLISNWEDTSKSFHRICEVKEVENNTEGDADGTDRTDANGSADELEITCSTTYDDNGRTGAIALKTILTDWKE